MDERLRKLKDNLGLEWGELAEKLCISRAMLGFIRRGDKPASSKLLRRIADLELSCRCNQATQSGQDSNQIATELARLNARIGDLSSRLDRLERILLDVLARLGGRR